ncbi:MAG: primosomal protein N' [Kiritimatiellae bacterium]|nr:primosomal protein N' [Kiritimatiellia bacterium]
MNQKQNHSFREKPQPPATPTVARVATEFAADRFFDYAVPPELAGRIRIGQQVRAEFGNRVVEAYVVELPQTAEPAANAPAESDLFGEIPAAAKRRLKPILEIVDDTPFLSRPLLELARWMADYTCSPFEIVLRNILPSVIRRHEVREKELFFVTPQSGDFELTKRQGELLDNLRRVDGGWLHLLAKEFSCSPGTLRKLEERGAVKIEKKNLRRNPMANRRILPTRPKPLMAEQETALRQIIELLDTDGKKLPLLLFGVTGSGKTEVYLQAIAHALERGKGAIVLVPEIALTPQTVHRFASRFGDKVAVLHSALGAGERYDEWHRIRTGEASVVVGPRSAVFAPVRDLGLIVVDEEHEPSYKQDETPHYHARDIAVMRAHLEKCAVVLGSATPSMESWNNVNCGKYRLATMAARVENRPMPAVQIVDMRLETARAGHAQIFSESLLDALRLRLDRGEQSILFLNRRGYSRSLVCPSCGYTATCEACALAYTYHQADSCLRCHICGDWKPLPERCPECGDPAFKYQGVGTQRVELLLKKCFPQARVLRMDADVTSRKHSHDEILSVFRSGQADILIGTQMIAKGLDFPNVTLVGVLSADTSLQMPDFRAAERTYQLLAQVSGRAGRAELPGEVYIQTYLPDHPAIRAAASDSGFAAFADRELAERRQGNYPPFSHLVCLTFKGTAEDAVRIAAEKFAEAMRGEKNAFPKLRVSAACPAPLAKAKGFFRYQLLLFAPSAGQAVRPLREVCRNFALPTGVTMSIDVDAVNIC